MFDFLRERAGANAAIARHMAYGPLRLALRADDTVRYARIDDRGIELGDRLPEGGVDLTLVGVRTDEGVVDHLGHVVRVQVVHTP